MDLGSSDIWDSKKFSSSSYLFFVRYVDIRYMDRKSIALTSIVAAVIIIAAVSFIVMYDDDEKKIGTDAYKVTLSLSVQEGLKCYIGEKEYFDGDTIVFYDDKTMKVFAPEPGTIKCAGSWSNPDGTATGGGTMEEYGTQTEYDLTWTAFYGDMSGSLTVTFVKGDPSA